MRKIFASLVIFLITKEITAQNPTGNRPGGNPQMNITGRFYGKILESVSGKPVEYASVQLIQNKFDTTSKQRKDVVISGMLTKPNGEFSLENIPVMGQYKLHVTGIGYKEFNQTISFELKMGGGGDPSAMLGALDKDLGNIKIEIDEKVLGNVTVESSKPGLQLAIDKKVFNVDKNIVSAGGTAVDVMRNVPSLNVDIDGNVTMRNNAPQVFVDGRPTTMTLDQIPADAIESVELITNPSAKFDASGGTSGILNIVLKKNRKVGYNGGIRANIDSRARVGGGGDINIRQNKLNVFANVNYNQRKSISEGTTERTTLIYNPNTFMLQEDNSTMKGRFAFLRGGIDYFINNRNTISVSGMIGQGKFNPNTASDITIDSLYNPKTTSFSQRFANTNGEFNNKGTQLSFKHNFPKAGREWTADLTYNSSRNNNNNLIETYNYNVPQYDLISSFIQRQIGNTRNKNLVVQTDYTNPINDKSKFETGLRLQRRENNSTNAFYIVNNGQLILQPSSQINYESMDYVYAAYATYSRQLKTIGYQLGLRAETSNYKGELTKTGEKFDIEFPVSLFPSVFVSKKISDNQDLQLNYTRRINRPNFWQLSPFTDSSDFLNRSKGNPGLKPEFTNSVELSYQKTFKNKDNFIASLYYKNTNDLITRYQVVETDPGNGKEIIMNTFINANSSYVTGLELVSKNKMAKWWDITSNLNLYTSKVNINDPAQPEIDQFASWFAKINNTFKLPKNFTIQLSGDYQSKTILPPGGSNTGGGRGGGFGGMFGSPSASQGYVRANYGVDAAIRYEFLKNRQASISMNINDIFRTRRQDVHSESSSAIQDMFRRRDPQVVRVNFNWRFGKFDATLFKRKNTRGERESQSGMDNMNF